MLTAASVWFMRNQSLMEMWWLFGTLMRYPREIFLRTAWVSPIGLFFSTVVPVNARTLPAGTVLQATFDQSIGTATSHEGDRFTATVSNAVIAQNGETVVPACVSRGSDAAIAKPKSPSFGVPSCASQTLSGFRSRWMML